jgi:hypothetical protein
VPLKAGASAKTRSTNIREMLHAFKATGRIGNSKPSSMKKAVKQAAAAAYRKQRETLAHRAGKGG